MKRGRLRPKKLAACVDLARTILIRKAKEGDTITYGELVNRMGGKPGTGRIGAVLDRIAELEREAGHPKLTAIVVRADTEMVGGGFFRLLDTPTKLLRTSPEKWRDRRLSAADLGYWQRQLTRVLQYWRSNEP